MAIPTTSPERAFTTECVRADGQLLLKVSGRLLDARHLSPGWQAHLPCLAADDVRVDLGDVTHLDARGLGMLAELARATHARGGRLTVLRASARIRRVLAITHLDSLLADDGEQEPPLAA